ncbi:MAG: HD domain-containing protein [Sandaracinaceae bacterium]|nr:HD domain-containing protein [Myxococcales bacterium]MCB9658960.1 HD domain-containing protein [Sandaracinaceae bacterium]
MLALTTTQRAQIPDDVVDLCRRLHEHGERGWIVGGCIRDVLLGRSISDWDVATSATPDCVQRVFRKVIPTGIEHGTVTVLHRGTPYEVTTLRGEGAYTDGRRPDEVFFVTDIDRDLARRDFTVNAIAYDPLEDTLIDPLGGLADLESRRLRAVGAPAERFGEDGLRILRGARFCATLGFDLEAATEAAFAGAIGVFAKVSRERVRDEWLKTMRAERPSRAFEVMRRTGILDVTLPELVEQHGCEQNRWHAYDVWHHTMAVLDAMRGDPTDKLSALLHDIAKPRTRALSEKTHDYTFYNHERVGADMADAFLREYRFSNDERQRVVHLVRHHLVCYQSSWTDAAVRRFVQRVGRDGIDPLLRLAEADALGKGRPVEEELASLVELRARVDTLMAAGAALSTGDLAVNGRDVLARLEGRGGPVVGEILRELLEAVLEDPTLNERDRLLGALDAAVAARREGASA